MIRRRRRTVVQLAARKWDSPVSSAGVEDYSARYIGTATSTNARSITGNSVPLKLDVIIPSWLAKRFRKFEHHPSCHRILIVHIQCRSSSSSSSISSCSSHQHRRNHQHHHHHHHFHRQRHRHHPASKNDIVVVEVSG